MFLKLFLKNPDFALHFKNFPNAGYFILLHQSITWYTWLPDISLHTTMPSELILHQVGIVGGGNKVMAQGLAQVLEDTPPPRVKNGALRGAKIHQEAIKRHGI